MRTSYYKKLRTQGHESTKGGDGKSASLCAGTKLGCSPTSCTWQPLLMPSPQLPRYLSSCLYFSLSYRHICLWGGVKQYLRLLIT